MYDLGLDREAPKAALGYTRDTASMIYEETVIDALPLTAPSAALEAQLNHTVDKAKNAK